MGRLTITLSKARDRAGKDAAVQWAKCVGQLIDESQEYCGIKFGSFRSPGVTPTLSRLMRLYGNAIN